MTITLVKGDIRKTRAQAIMLGMNTQGAVEVSPLETTLRDQYPVFYSEYRRLGRSKALTAGQLWFFRDAAPWFVGALIRDAANSVSRIRHLEQALITLRRDWQREGLKSLAVAPLGDPTEWGTLKEVLQEYLSPLPIPILLYDEYIPDQSASEPDLIG